MHFFYSGRLTGSHNSYPGASRLTGVHWEITDVDQRALGSDLRRPQVDPGASALAGSQAEFGGRESVAVALAAT